jgi:hypothetical protein
LFQTLSGCNVFLRRSGKALVARFTRFAVPQEIRRAAKEDRFRAEPEPNG